MYLLIPLMRVKCHGGLSFTFHNVSINSCIPLKMWLGQGYLHSIMYLLIPPLFWTSVLTSTHLHSIMYLLIPKIMLICFASTAFTFHNVSINSLRPQFLLPHQRHLHSIMYLLIPWDKLLPFIGSFQFTFHNVSINSHSRKHLGTLPKTIYIP